MVSVCGESLWREFVVRVCGESVWCVWRWMGVGSGEGHSKITGHNTPPPQKCTGLTAGGRPSQEMGTGGVGGGGLRTGRAQIFDTNK